jgi:hypothetical protein
VASICGKCVRDWSFEFFLLDGNHLLAVALGPVDDATESFRVTMRSPFHEPTRGHSLPVGKASSVTSTWCTRVTNKKMSQLKCSVPFGGLRAMEFPLSYSDCGDLSTERIALSPVSSAESFSPRVESEN